MESDQGIEMRRLGAPMPDRPTRRTPAGLIVAKLTLVSCQCFVALLCYLYYGDLYAASSYGAAALVSSALSGLSEGLVEAAFSRRLRPSRIAKFYVWGIVNGAWTKMWTDQLNAMFKSPEAKILSDQLIGSPFAIFMFVSFSAYWDGLDIDAFLQKNYIPMVRASLMVWPAASVAIFYFIPVNLTVPFNAVVNLFWTMILSFWP